MKVSSETGVYVVIGDPVKHSLSPYILNAAFQALNLNSVYVALTVKREGLRDAISGVRALGLRGLNVTMPHKTAIIQYLDALEESTRRIGAVNTVLNADGGLIGYNTDGIGALRTLRENGGTLEGKRVVILGAGGAARAIAHSLAQIPCHIVVLNRTVEKAEALAKEVGKGAKGKVVGGTLNKEALGRELADANLLINATPVGMYPWEEESPVDITFLRRDLTVFDLVYNPVKTRLLEEARAVGAKTLDGIQMLVYQAAGSFEIWTGVKAPVEVMMKAVEEAPPRLSREG